MERVNTDRNYAEFVRRYQDLVQRYNEIQKELEDRKFSLKPSAIKRHGALKRESEDLYDEICDYEDFATDTLTFDRDVALKFITKFYSNYFGKELKVIEIMDNKDSKYAVKSYLVVTLADYALLNAKFDGFKRAVNSEQVMAACREQVLSLRCGKKCSFYDGLYLSSSFKEFKEIDEVLEMALSYKLQNNKESNVTCLQKALGYYLANRDIFTQGGSMMGYPGESSYEEDSFVTSEISQVVQQAIIQEKAEQEKSSRRILGMVDGLAGLEKGEESASQTILGMLDSVVPLEKSSDMTRIVVPAPAPAPAPQPAPVPGRVPVGDSRPVRVVAVEPAPASKATQYNAATTVLLDMLSDLVAEEEAEQHRKIK